MAHLSQVLRVIVRLPGRRPAEVLRGGRRSGGLCGGGGGGGDVLLQLLPRVVDDEGADAEGQEGVQPEVPLGLQEQVVQVGGELRNRSIFCRYLGRAMQLWKNVLKASEVLEKKKKIQALLNPSFAF